MKEIKIFVYGTLMNGFCNYDKYLKNRSIILKTAYVRGKLYNLKKLNCPGMIQGNDKVYGQYMIIKDDDDYTVLKRVDELEKYFGNNDKNTNKEVFSRKEVEVYLENGKEKAYAYFFNLKEELNNLEAEYIEHGDWKQIGN